MTLRHDCLTEDHRWEFCSTIISHCHIYVRRAANVMQPLTAILGVPTSCRDSMTWRQFPRHQISSWKIRQQCRKSLENSNKRILDIFANDKRWWTISQDWASIFLIFKIEDIRQIVNSNNSMGMVRIRGIRFHNTALVYWTVMMAIELRPPIKRLIRRSTIV